MIGHPYPQTLAVLERELMVAPSEAAAVRVAPDRATSFALVRDRTLDRRQRPLVGPIDQRHNHHRLHAR